VDVQIDPVLWTSGAHCLTLLGLVSALGVCRCGYGFLETGWKGGLSRLFSTMDWMPLWTNACDRGRWTRQSDSACAAVLGRVRPPRRSGATRYEPRHGWFLPWGALRVVLKRKRFSPCTSAKSDRRAYVGEQFGWAAAGPHGPRLGYGLVTLVMRRRGSFGCDAFDGLYYRTNGLFYILYLYGTSSHNAIQVRRVFGPCYFATQTHRRSI
jgi:hypothetical protein